MKKNNLNKDQQGIIAIFSVMIIMGILTLLTVGFSNITRQAQKRALDDFLNTQAFYAAETGINGALTAIRGGSIAAQNTNCDGVDTQVDYDIDAARNIGISCLLVNPNPPNIVFDSVPEVGVDEPVVSAVKSFDATNISTLLIEWDSQNGTDPIVNFGFNGGSPVFTPDGVWGNAAGAGVGVMRIDLVPALIAPSNRANLVNQSYTFYVYPTLNGGVPPNNAIGVLPGPGDQAGTLMTRCTSAGDYRCVGRINVIPSYNNYFIRLQSYYNPVRTSITALDATGNEVRLEGGQAIIDSTGRANDVFRRVQVRVPITTDGAWQPGFHEVFAIFSGDSLCKRYIGAPPAAGGGGGTRVARPTGVTDPSCNLN